MSNILGVKLKWTKEVENFLREQARLVSTVSPDATHTTYWFNSNSYIVYKAHQSKSLKHQPLIPFKLLPQLMLLPTAEARTEVIKATVKRKWD